MAKKKGKSMMQPRDIEGSRPGKEDTQMYHQGAGYYGKGYGDFSNMPSEVVHTKYPYAKQSLDNNAYPDTIEEIDENCRYNERKVAEHRSDSMY